VQVDKKLAFILGSEIRQLLYYPILVGILPMAVCLVLTVMLLIQFGRAHAKAKEILIQSVIYVSN